MLAKELARQDRLWPKLTELTSLETAGLVNEEKEAWVEPVPEVEVKKTSGAFPKKKNRFLTLLLRGDKESVLFV